MMVDDSARPPQRNDCDAIPSASVTTVSVTTGIVGAPTFNVSVVTNYRSGQVSLFVGAGIQGGINPGLSGQFGIGAVYGMSGDNSEFGKIGTTSSASVGVGPVAAGVSSGSGGPGLSSPLTAFDAFLADTADPTSLQLTINVNAFPIPFRFPGSIALTNTLSQVELFNVNDLGIPDVGLAVLDPITFAFLQAHRECGTSLR